jgi:arginyl-tRNA--protein-N-Asp/Glu arginylyltransferase
VTLPATLELIRELVRIPSVSSADPALDMGNRPVVERLAEWMESLGWSVEAIPLPGAAGKANLVARLGNGDDALVLAGHTDTVPWDEGLWSCDPFDLTERDGRLYGLGTADMKGFLALVVDAVRDLRARDLRRPLVVVATADEETSMAGARALPAELGRYCVIGEPTGLAPVYRHKGILMEGIRLRGTAGHSSDLDAGNSALEGMSSQELNLWITPQFQCGYFPDRLSVNLLVDPDAALDPATYGGLLDLGFRRSGAQVYRPHCPGCGACVATRIPVRRFQPNRSQRRTLRRNRDLETRVLEAGFRDEHFELYRRYQAARHTGGPMDDPDPRGYRDFLFSPWARTWMVEFRAAGRLLCVAVCDRVPQGLSALYTFFDPEHAARGLGTHALLWQIEATRRMGGTHVYPGYWIAEHPKMDYKRRFRPLEGFVSGRWAAITDVGSDKPPAGPAPPHPSPS